MDPTVTTLAERPELAEELGNMPMAWPIFIGQDRSSRMFYERIFVDFPEHVLVGTDDSGELVAQALSVPFALSAPDRGTLPPGGWDEVMLWAFHDRWAGRKPDTVSMIAILVNARHRGRGLATTMLAALRDNVRKQGFGQLVAPLRPVGKLREPDTPMIEYAFRTGDDGLPTDPWIRVHVRAGAVIDSVAPTSMVVVGSLGQWRDWTGQSFAVDGAVRVPGTLAPVRCDLAADHGVYVEPNVWVRHRLG